MTVSVLPIRPAWAPAMVLLLSLIALTSVKAEQREVMPGAIDEPMHTTPALVLQTSVRQLPEGIALLWSRALRQPDLATRLEAVLAFGQASSLGLQTPADVLERMKQWATQSSQPMVLRLGSADTLITMDVVEAASALKQANQEGQSDMLLLTDPALARWAAQSMSSIWQTRLLESTGELAVRVSAANALGAGGLTDAFATLLQVVQSSEPMPLRSAAARAIGRIADPTATVVDAAIAMAASNTVADRMMAALMLQSVQDAQGWQVLVKLVDDRDPAVMAMAIDHVVQVRPELITVAMVRNIARRADAPTRLAAGQAMRVQASAASVRALGPMLDDRNPDNRAQMRVWLLELAEMDELRRVVDAVLDQAIASESWRVLEQACLMAGWLDRADLGERLVELMRHPRPEVRLGAVVGLRWIADERFLPAMRQRAAQLQATTIDPEGGDPQVQFMAIREELSQLFQAFGQMRDREAQPLARRMIPKEAGQSKIRAAAIWALGQMYENTPDQELIGLFMGRLSDVNPMNPESEDVRAMSAVAVGWMKPQRVPAQITRFNTVEESLEVAAACRWAFAHITGQPIEVVGPEIRIERDWFLVPLR